MQPYVVVSDELQHEKNSVTTFLTDIVKDLQKKIPDMTQLHIFSDGAASQFKNRLLSSTIKEMSPQISTEWHYFATSHGKGALDGVGWTVKRAVSMAVLSRQVVVANASTFAETARRVCPKMEVLYVTNEDIKEFCNKHEIAKYWEHVTPLPGTLNVHSVTPVSWGQVQHKAYSTATTTAHHTLVQQPPSSTDEDSTDDEAEVNSASERQNLTTGDCVLVKYEGKSSRREYVGLVTDYDENAIEVEFLRKSYELGHIYILPTKEDKSWGEFLESDQN